MVTIGKNVRRRSGAELFGNQVGYFAGRVLGSALANRINRVAIYGSRDCVRMQFENMVAVGELRLGNLEVWNDPDTTYYHVLGGWLSEDEKTYMLDLSTLGEGIYTGAPWLLDRGEHGWFPFVSLNGDGIKVPDSGNVLTTQSASVLSVTTDGTSVYVEMDQPVFRNTIGQLSSIFLTDQSDSTNYYCSAASVSGDGYTIVLSFDGSPPLGNSDFTMFFNGMIEYIPIQCVNAAFSMADVECYLYAW